jgi:phosphatidylglycerol lysyltransferase
MKNRWILWVLIVAFVWIVVTRFTEIEKLAATLSQGQWEWVLAAAIIQVIYFVVFAASYWSAFDAVEVKSRLRDLLPVVFGSLFVNVVAPAGGTTGVALFVDDARRRGESPARATAGTLLQLIADFSAFTLLLVTGLVYLFIQHDLKVYEIIAALILFAIIAALSTVLLLGLWRPPLLRRLLGWIQGLANSLAARFKRPPFLADEWVDHNAAEFTEAAAAVGKRPARLARTILFALAAHLLDLACLYVLFLAFHQDIKFGPLVAGYAMGILFWIVSITPQGIGVVEGVMALVYTSLGVQAEIATTVSLAFRGLTFWMPLALGFLLLRRVKSFGAGERSLAEGWSVRVVSLLVGLMGIVNLISAVTPALSDRLAMLEQYLPLEVRQGSHLTAALAGFALLLLSVNLWRRKRVAWGVTLTVLLVSAVSHLLKGLDYEEALLAGGLALWLAFLYPHFHARSDRPSTRQGLRVLAGALLFTLAYGTVGFDLLDQHYSVNFGFWAALHQTVVMFTQFYNPGLEPITGFGRYFADSIYMVGAITLAYAAIQLLRPVFIRQPATAVERARAKAIVEAYGHSSLARICLFDDKIYFFSPGGSVIAYAVRGRAAVTLGDPIGPSADIPACIAAFQSLCARNDWQPAFYQVLSDNLEAYRAAGFQVLCIGHEGIVDLNSFTLSGGENKGMRSAVNRLTRLGFYAEVVEPLIPSDMLTVLRHISDEWLTAMHGSEKRFSLGWFDDEYLRNAPLIVIRSPEGRVDAFANIVSEYQINEITIDLMRHRREVESGMMDFLFVSLFEWAKEKGYATFNLGLSSLSGIGEHPEDPAIERAMHYIYEHVNQFYNFKGLHAFKEKFHPAWSPRYLIYPNTASLPTIVLAMAQSDSGSGNFLAGYLKRK